MQVPKQKGTKELFASCLQKGCTVFPNSLRGMDWMSSAALDEVDEDGQRTGFRGMQRHPEAMLIWGPGLGLRDFSGSSLSTGCTTDSGPGFAHIPCGDLNADKSDKVTIEQRKRPEAKA